MPKRDDSMNAKLAFSYYLYVVGKHLRDNSALTYSKAGVKQFLKKRLRQNITPRKFDATVNDVYRILEEHSATREESQCQTTQSAAQA
jgi:hypothetical protein